MLSALGVWAVCLGFISGLVGASPVVQPAVRVRTPPGRTPQDVVEAVRRGVGAAANGSQAFRLEGQTTLDKSWDGAVLLQLAMEQTAMNGSHGDLSFSESIEIVCTTCYVKGSASAVLSAGHFNMSRIVDQTVDEIEGDFQNFTSEVADYVEDVIKEVFDDVGDDIVDFFHGDFDFDDFEMPTLNYTFHMDIPALPEVNLRFGFDSLELYMMLDTTLSLGSTYTYNLYTSDTPIGMDISEYLDLGITFTVDLILAVDAVIDISSGFHIKLDDGLAIDIALFSDKASGIDFNGGQFEFLPVRVESAGAVFTAVLRLGVHAGFELDADFGALADISDFTLGAGVEVGVFANVAEFTTNVTYQPDVTDCEFGIEQTYQFAVGAAAGATIAIGTQTWGPTPNTSIPIFYTTMASACAMKGTPTLTAANNYTAAASALAQKRQDMTTTTITTAVTYTGVNCLSTGLVNCPASLQNTSQSTTTTTFTTVVPSGIDADDITVPARSSNTVATTVPFGTNAMKLPTSTGSPVSYIPPPPTSTHHANGTILDDIEHDLDKAVIIGVSVGLGVPLLLAVIALVFIAIVWRRQQKYSAVPLAEAKHMSDEELSFHKKPRQGNVHITEVYPLAFTPRP